MRTPPRYSLYGLVILALVMMQMPLKQAYTANGLTISIGRDISYGLPYEGIHNSGLNDIVSGVSTTGTTISVVLQRQGSVLKSRTTSLRDGGEFTVSLDQAIEDGDRVIVSNGVLTRTIDIPSFTVRVLSDRHMVVGIAPTHITNTQLGTPHSLSISFGMVGQQSITTDAHGYFKADFSSTPFQPAAVAALKYITPDGDTIIKSLFASDPFARGKKGDAWADVILGQPDFNQVTFNETTDNALFNPNGVYVDRSTIPNRVYVYDAGNSRILGFRSIGITSTGQACTSFSDFNKSCQILPNRAADIIIGQPSASTSTCNGDSAYQHYPDVVMASAATLCGMREEQMSLSEGGSGITMASDAQGNLYVPDFFNNRVLRYNDPFETDRIADYVWGQADFSGIHCNRGASVGKPANNTLCFADHPGSGNLFAGVAIDAANNLWVADTTNQRVVRFPFNPSLGVPDSNANLVLGQSTFTSAWIGSSLAQMNFPASIRVNNAGKVYVADSLNNRILVFDSPNTNGVSASRLLGSNITQPLGLEIDAEGGVWVDDIWNYQFRRFVNETQVAVVPSLTSAWGGLGIDRDGNVMWTGWTQQQVLHFARISNNNYVYNAAFLTSQDGLFNRTTARSLYGGQGLEVTDNQLIHSDYSRILFWNNPESLTNHQPADGVIGEANFQTRHRYGPYFERMRAGGGTLWVVGGNFIDPATLYGYALPLVSGANPSHTINSPLPLVGGGSFTWTKTVLLSGVAYQENCDCIWLSDEDSHRVFRIRHVSTSPMVDVVIGQKNSSSTECNQGRGQSSPSADSLCHPGAISLDSHGNLFISDHNTEFDGNLRLLVFDASSIPLNPSTVVFGLSATHVFGRASFTDSSCPPIYLEGLCAPWEISFDTNKTAVIGMNGYFRKFAMIYQNILENPRPLSAIGDYQSMPMSARFDAAGNMYMLDHNRSRILIYHGGVYSFNPNATLLLKSYIPSIYLNVTDASK